jgi:transaldolase
MSPLQELPIKVFADGADLAGMLALNASPLIRGMTTNPTLMNKSGIKDYEAFAREVLSSVKDKPVSFEVFSDDFAEMRRQALKISAWQDNVFVKIPVMNPRGEPSYELIRDLAMQGVQLNVTAVLALEQVRAVAAVLNPDRASVVSVFAGRIADTGRDPAPIIRESLKILSQLPKAELLWASVREVLNIFQAAECGAHIVTVPHDILNKAMKMAGMDLTELSLDTVRMFDRDAKAAGFRL